MVIGDNKRAFIWSGLDKIASYAVNFLVQIVLARLLIPDDYTVVAMLAIFFAISQSLIDSGFATTLIQRKHCTHKDYCSVFYFNIVLSIILYIVLFAIAPLVESFYHFPNLAMVMRIYSISLVVGSIGMVHRTILTKELKFKRIAIVGFVSAIISAIPAIIMAFNGWGYWALVTSAIVSSTSMTIFYAIFSRWRPTLTFSMSSIRLLAPFGLRIMSVSIVHAIYNNIYSLVIGKRYQPQELGLYDRSKTLANSFSVGFSDFFNRALYPIQAKIQDDNLKLENSYFKAFGFAAGLTIPICIFLSVFSYECILVLFGEKWIDASWMLSILSIGYIFYPLQAINIGILKVKGRGDYLLKSELLKKIVSIIAVLGAVQFDLVIVVMCWSVCAFYEFLVGEAYCYRLMHYSLLRTFKLIALPFIVSILIALPLKFLLFDNFQLNFLLKILFSLVIYFPLYGLVMYRRLRSFRNK